MFEYFKEYLDFRTLIITLLLVGIGLFSVYSSTYDARAGEIFQRQLLWSGIGILALLGAAFVPLRTVQRIAFPLYGRSILVLLIVLVLGRTTAGSRSWFGVGGLGVQPSELAKVVTVLAVAAFVGRTTTTLSSRKDLAITMGLILLPTVLILAQPDLGTALVFLAMMLPILYWAGVDAFFLSVLISPVIVAIGALFGTTLFVLGVEKGLKFIYLAVILDLYSRKVIGYAISRQIDTALSLQALRMAVQNRDPPPGVIHHSDRGVQYAAHDYINELRNHKFEISMSLKGNPYDNAFAESFMKTIKTEEVYLWEYQTLDDVLIRIPYFIEDVYNRKRLHASLGYMPPNKFEARSQTLTPCPAP